MICSKVNFTLFTLQTQHLPDRGKECCKKANRVEYWGNFVFLGCCITFYHRHYHHHLPECCNLSKDMLQSYWQSLLLACRKYIQWYFVLPDKFMCCWKKYDRVYKIFEKRTKNALRFMNVVLLRSHDQNVLGTLQGDENKNISTIAVYRSHFTGWF